MLVAVASGSSQQGKSTLILLLAGIITSLTGMKVLVTELEEKGRIARLRQKEITSLNTRVAVITYDIIQIAPLRFHSSIIHYTHTYDLIFIEIPNAGDLGLYADVFLLSQVILCPVVALPENRIENQLFLGKLSRLKALKASRNLPVEIFGLFNKFRLGQDAGSYLGMNETMHMFSSFLKFSLNYQIDLSSLNPVLPENSLEELILVAKEFLSTLPGGPFH